MIRLARLIPILALSASVLVASALPGPVVAGGPEKDKGPKPPPAGTQLKLKEMSPRVGVAGRATNDVEIDGAGFRANVQFFLFPMGNVPLGTTPAQPVIPPSDTLIRLTLQELSDEGKEACVTVPPLQPGRYGLFAVQGNETAVLPNAFTATGPTSTPPSAGALRIESVAPRQVMNDRDRVIKVMGTGFRPGLTVTLSSSIVPAAAITPAATALVVVKVEPTKIEAMVPAGLRGGLYDVRVANTDGGTARAPGALAIVEAINDNLTFREESIFTDPRIVRTGETVTLGAFVTRRGGQAPLVGVRVRFYLGTPAENVVIGTVTLPPLAPNATEIAQTVWNTGGLTGTALITAVIDPDNAVREATKLDNTTSRRVVIQPAASGDVSPPKIDSFRVNGGATTTVSPTVQVTTQITDPSGVAGMMVVERVFLSSVREWAPVQVTGWFSYTPTFSFTLADGGGARILQLWAVDTLGNIAGPTRALINYTPLTDTVRQGQVRVYRAPLAVGDRLDIALTTLTGDADLYLFGPDRKLIDRSILGGTATDRIVYTATVAGMFQIEVEGYEASTFHLSFVVNGLLLPAVALETRGVQAMGVKPLRTVAVTEGVDESFLTAALPPANRPSDASGAAMELTVFVPGASVRMRP